MEFLRAFSYLFAPALILSGGLSWISDADFVLISSIALVTCAVMAALVTWFSEKVGSAARIVYMGSGQHSKKDRFSSDIARARYLKSKEMYTQALVVVGLFLEVGTMDPDIFFKHRFVFLDP
jgi:hypothetical protein